MRFGLCFVLLLSVPVTWGASRQAVVSYLSVPDGAVTDVLATDSAGDLFVVSTGTDLAGDQTFRIVKSDPHGAILAEMDFGGPSDTIVAAVVDPVGNLILAGNTLSPGFPFVQPLFAKIHGETGFIVKLDSQLQSILFSTLLTGSASGTLVYALALDAKGDIFVTGETSDPTFPVTAGAFQMAPPTSGDNYAFVTEISADDKGIVFSTYFGRPGNCGDGTLCLNFDYGTAIALDSAGNIVIGGYATAGQIPVTPGVYGSSCGDCSDKSTGFLAKFSADGSRLIWATYIPASSGNLQVDIQALALGSQGNVVVVGSSTGPFPVTPGALQTTNPDAIPGGEGYAGFVAKFDPLAQKLLFATYFGGQGSVNGVSLDSQGSIWITGSSASNELPVTKDTVLLGTTYVANLSADGSTLLYMVTAPSQAAGQAIVQTNSSSIVALGTAASLLTVTDTTGPSIVGIVNSAGSSVSPVVAPKELISIYGIDIGPSPPATAQVNQGVAPSSLDGTTVTFDGMTASLLYVSPTQINAVVPDQIRGRESVTMVISTPSGSAPPVVIPVRPSHPQVFSTSVNEDGTVNSASNPAKRGSIVSVWSSGAGFITGGQDLLLPISVLAIQRTSAEQFISYSMEVLYAGQAPGLIKGLAQINFRLPAGDETGEFQLQAGTALSDPFTIFVDP